MGIDGERRKRLCPECVGVHIRAHQHGPLGGHGDPVEGLPIGIHTQCQGRFAALIQHVRDLFDTDDQYCIDHPCSHRELRLADGHTASSPTGFDGQRLDPTQPQASCHGRGQIALIAQCSTQCVGHIHRPDRAGVAVQCLAGSVVCQILCGFVPMLSNRCLTDAGDIYRSHTLTPLPICCAILHTRRSRSSSHARGSVRSAVPWPGAS